MQLAKTIFLTFLSIMKKILDLIAFKCDKKSDDYKFYKKQIMDYIYNGMRDLFKKLQSEKVIERCHCGADLRNGYSDCQECSGSGYKNLEK
jgi:hypothetical protein